ncbi:MAG: DNA gyrase inhibitor YacG [Chthoniobacteraceae bacterium]|nr:DNA gyrase inhibitor YacG [Chthoniobacteraceae bacterium]
MATLIRCPICGRENDFFAEPLGPFCTVRCKQVDLGKWLGEEYRISEPLDADALEDGELPEVPPET